jgi:hypothetical protein
METVDPAREIVRTQRSGSNQGEYGDPAPYFGEIPRPSEHDFNFLQLDKPSKTVHLTPEARHRLEGSANPQIIVLFGPTRAGKSTTGSHLLSAFRESHTTPTVFKAQGRMRLCTVGVQAVGPIPTSEFLKRYQLGGQFGDDDREFFIVDTEGLDSAIGASKIGLLALFHVASVSAYLMRAAAILSVFV